MTASRSSASTRPRTFCSIPIISYGGARDYPDHLERRANYGLKTGVYKAIADGLHSAVGLRRGDVFINLIEVKKENWSFGNGEASTRSKAESFLCAKFSERHALLALICTSAPSFMLQLVANIVSVSLPVIAGSLNAAKFRTWVSPMRPK